MPAWGPSLATCAGLVLVERRIMRPSLALALSVVRSSFLPSHRIRGSWSCASLLWGARRVKALSVVRCGKVPGWPTAELCRPEAWCWPKDPAQCLSLESRLWLFTQDPSRRGRGSKRVPSIPRGPSVNTRPQDDKAFCLQCVCRRRDISILELVPRFLLSVCFHCCVHRRPILNRSKCCPVECWRRGTTVLAPPADLA